VGRLVNDDPPTQGLIDPLNAINWDVARKEIGLPFVVLVEETGKQLLQWARHAIPA
jgi:hypothetical protein